MLEEEQQRDQRDKLITALASDYRGVYYVVLDEDEGVCYQEHSEIIDGFHEGQHFAFQEGISGYGKRYVTEQYRDEFMEFIKPENIREGLMTERVISYRYLIEREGVESYEMIRFAGVRHPEDRDDGIVHAVGMCFSDVDAETRRNLEQTRMLGEALTAAEEANKAKTAFLSNMSHEIRTPMNAIIGLDSTVLFALLVYCAIMWVAKAIAATGGLDVQGLLFSSGIVLLAIIFVGLIVMLYIQNFVRKKHEAAEREKIRAVEGSLAKSQFLFNMSHDIRTPMNAIIGYTNLALKEESSPVVHDYLTKISASSDHLLELINDILEMSRIESGHLSLEYAPTDLGALFDGIRDLFAEQMKQKGLDFSVHTDQVRDRFVWCDRKNINRVLLNVVSNAFKFTEPGGTISVTVWENADDEADYNAYSVLEDGTLERLMNDDFIARIIVDFAADTSCTDLIEAWKSGDDDAAFQAAHKTKGVCANLSLTKLADQASRITEALRPGNEELRQSTDVDALVAQFAEAHKATVEAIGAFAQERG